VEAPSDEFIRPCNLCPHMKRITLAGIHHALETETIEITVDPLVSVRARAAVEAMLKVRPKAQRRAAA
jgi:quinolinate synthase